MAKDEDLYTEHAKNVYRYLFSLSGEADTAEELTQETFYRALKSLDSYRGEASRRFIKNCKNIPVEERIKFLYEALSSNENYNCLAITHKDKRRGCKKLLFEIDKWHQKTDIVTFSIDDL